MAGLKGYVTNLAACPDGAGVAAQVSDLPARDGLPDPDGPFPVPLRAGAGRQQPSVGAVGDAADEARGAAEGEQLAVEEALEVMPLPVTPIGRAAV